MSIYRHKLNKSLPSDPALASMIADLKKWLPMTEEQILARAVNKYHTHHVDKRAKRVGRFTKHQMLLNQGHRCYYCAKYINSKQSTVDHKLPVSRGGKNNPENLCVSCLDCNATKESMTEKEFWIFRSPIKGRFMSLIRRLQ